MTRRVKIADRVKRHQFESKWEPLFHPDFLSPLDPYCQEKKASKSEARRSQGHQKSLSLQKSQILDFHPTKRENALFKVTEKVSQWTLSWDFFCQFPRSKNDTMCDV